MKIISNYSFPAHAQTAGYGRICKATEKRERFDFDEKLPAHPDVSFPEAETSASNRTLLRLSAS